MSNSSSNAAPPRPSAPTPGGLVPEFFRQFQPIHFTDWRRFALRTGHVPHSPPPSPSF
jgi:hypothetical protein